MTPPERTAATAPRHTTPFVVLLVGFSLLSSIVAAGILGFSLFSLFDDREDLARLRSEFQRRSQLYAHAINRADRTLGHSLEGKDQPTEVAGTLNLISEALTATPPGSLLRLEDTVRDSLRRQKSLLRESENLRMDRVEVQAEIEARLSQLETLKLDLEDITQHPEGFPLLEVLGHVEHLLEHEQHGILHIPAPPRSVETALQHSSSNLGSLRAQLEELDRATERRDLQPSARVTALIEALHASIGTPAEGRGDHGLADRLLQRSRLETHRRNLNDRRDLLVASASDTLARFDRESNDNLNSSLARAEDRLKDGLTASFGMLCLVAATAGVVGWMLPKAIRKQMEKLGQLNDTLRHQSAELLRLSLIAKRTDNPVVLTDPQARIEWVNAAFERMSGYSLADLLGRTPGSVLQCEETDAAMVQYMRQSIREGRGFRAEVLNRNRRGERYWVQIDAQPICNDRGILTHYMSIQRDMTLRREAEQTLIKAKEAAEAASRAKAEFLAVMSHEIRTPLNGIIGFCSVLSVTDLDQEQRECVQAMETSGLALLTLLNDMLDFSQIDSGKLVIESVPVQPRKLLADVICLFEAKARENSVTIRERWDPLVPEVILSDPMRIRQILMNLVGNAVKFTKDGCIEIHGAFEPVGPDQGNLRFTIADTGIGISEEQLDRLFQPFVQADSSTTRKYGGTGLGLAICKRLCDLLRGKISVTSSLGRGSTFTVTIPTGLAASAPAPRSDLVETARPTLGFSLSGDQQRRP